MAENIVAGNWKMNTTPSEGIALAQDIVDQRTDDQCTLILIPPFTHLPAIGAILAGSNIKLGAQTCHEEANGAYTGEVSAKMLKDLGVEYVIIGHSERRQYFGESHQTLARKTDAVLENDMTVIFCCGETLSDRTSGFHFDVVWKQVSESLFHLNENMLDRIVIAYEPVWAIGTGQTATKEQAQEMHAHIRKMLSDRYSKEVSETVSILYGGSVKKENARALFGERDIDGGLIGGAALSADGFLAIAGSFA